jgi:hypothetical protein
MEFPFVEVLEIGGWCRDCTHAARRLTRFSGPGHYCSANHPNGQGGRSCTLVAVRKHPLRSEQGRLLLTLHPENGCQTWTRTKTSGLTGRRATLTLSGNGAAGRISTCIVPFRRRMPHVFDHGSNLKLVGMAGLDFQALQSVSPDETFASRQANHLRPPGPKVLAHRQMAL